MRLRLRLRLRAVLVLVRRHRRMTQWSWSLERTGVQHRLTRGGRYGLVDERKGRMSE